MSGFLRCESKGQESKARIKSKKSKVTNQKGELWARRFDDRHCPDCVPGQSKGSARAEEVSSYFFFDFLAFFAFFAFFAFLAIASSFELMD
jgi:hypothetical protein